MAAADGDDSLYPIAVLIDELRNEDVQVRKQRELEEEGKGDLGARASLAEKVQCSLGVAEGAAANQRSVFICYGPRTR